MENECTLNAIKLMWKRMKAVKKLKEDTSKLYKILAFRTIKPLKNS